METQYHASGERSGISSLLVTKRSGAMVAFELQKIKGVIERLAGDFLKDISIELIADEVRKNIYDKVTTQDVEKALVMASVAFIERDPAYDVLAARLLIQRAYKEVFGRSVNEETTHQYYCEAFVRGIRQGVDIGIFDERMLDFDFEKLSNGLCIERDRLFGYIGIQTLYDRYFLKVEDERVELPQTFWMRVAMGLALEEGDQKNERALEFYDALSQLRYVASTPTLFHSGYKVAQLSSCYLSTVNDDLHHIFKVVGDNAQLSKWAGGIGNDWTNIRGTGAWIKSIRATSQGVVPYLKIVNDIVTGITRSGIRRGGACVYLETWHFDIEEFLDLRRNTGDERRRTHDLNTANWIPDLFMKRVIEDKEWTLFSPDEVRDLHDLYGSAFEKRYEEYEAMARRGEIKLFKIVEAKKLWRKMLSRLFETGHPWITFKDPCNVRSPQDHAGVVHSSNLCTEITLNTSPDETAVCNLGSVNFARHVKNGQLDKDLLAKTIKTAVRMLDNVIDINFYPTVEANNANLRHRPVGLGQMGFQDLLFGLNVPFGSDKAIQVADEVGEFVSYHAVLASSELAKERGSYTSYKGSKWDRGIMQVDTIALLEKERGMAIEGSKSSSLDWQPVKDHIKQWGMRNSNVTSIAPTASISNISGCYPCIEPMYKNLYVKSNITGEFTIVNKYLVNDLKKRGLWSQNMLELLKFYDGDLDKITVIPKELKQKYKGAFEIDPVHLIKITAARGKWIDQSQSHNVFMKGVSGKKLSEIYETAWRYGMKTMYYLRTLGASQIEKSTLDSKYGFTQKRSKDGDSAQEAEVAYSSSTVYDPNEISCESCQ